MKISEAAQGRLDETLGDTEYLRVSVDGGGCSGFMVGFRKQCRLLSCISEGDIWLSHNVLSDKPSLSLLTRGVLEWIDDPFNPKFKVAVPDTNECGCGDSFQFKA